ncbi:MAG: glucose-6-phosphate isomerase [Alphaproteobacteria bacterium]|nr:MAG: glucose-6-phosphate isomerase [Alphaproteobacteria bacterium]
MSVDWQPLVDHAAEVRTRRIVDLFDADAGRAEDFSVVADGLAFDYSKTNICGTGRRLLLDLAAAAGVEARREAMFRGEKINVTERRAVLHTALRNLDGGPVLVDGTDVMPEVLATLERMEAFAEGVRSGGISGPGGRYTDVVNIGIGGSDLGPLMATRALAPYHGDVRVHFVSNVDGAHIHDVLEGLDPTRTLVIVASKTFTTIETMTNARTALAWVEAGGGNSAQFVALSSAVDRTQAFGIPDRQVFGFADWVGGRYSVWGPIGLSLMIAIGPRHFRDFLAGGQAMDRHFRTAPADRNMPVMLALVGIWHNQVLGHATRAVLPYEERLARLPAYLQQLEMESNGKRVTLDGAPAAVDTGPVVWGEPGTNGQHAFFQLLHQGTRVVPCEFMVGAEGHEPELAHHHRLLVANCLAQSKALLEGRTEDEARAMMLAAGADPAEADRLAPHRTFPGNRPSTTLVYPRLTPFVLGQIIALYEHRVFVEGTILGINSFDQWGVELGKELAGALLPAVEGRADVEGTEGSTAWLLARLRDMAGQG